MPCRITLLGATGSVGRAACEFLQTHPEKFEVVAITGHRNVARLVEIANLLKPELVVISDPQKWAELQIAFDHSAYRPELACGIEGLKQASSIKVDKVLAAIVGAAGLSPTLQAAKNGAIIALANKECLVMAGKFLMELAPQILPVDSEHNAIFQVLSDNRTIVKKLILTSSGGPFHNFTPEQMQHITPAQAVKHPNWNMGAKISVDSATMMNKALELIEAKYLFQIPPDKLDIVVHPEQIIHSMVHYCDGSILAQMGVPDMYLPVAHALAYPERLPAPPQYHLDFTDCPNLTFCASDSAKFPALSMVKHILSAPQEYSITFNAANEIAVQAFLDSQISYLTMMDIVQATLDKANFRTPTSVYDVISIDKQARKIAQDTIKNQS